MSGLNAWLLLIGIPGVPGLVGLLSWLWSRRKGSVSWVQRLARWSSATGRLPIAEDAVAFTQADNTSLRQQRDQLVHDRDWLQSELDRKDSVILDLRSELSRLRQEFPTSDSSDDSSAGSTKRVGERRPRKPGNDS